MNTINKYFVMGLLAIAFAISNIMLPSTSLAGDQNNGTKNNEYYQSNCCYYYNNR